MSSKANDTFLLVPEKSLFPPIPTGMGYRATFLKTVNSSRLSNKLEKTVGLSSYPLGPFRDYEVRDRLGQKWVECFFLLDV
jgi:hypothetical protein